MRLGCQVFPYFREANRSADELSNLDCGQIGHVMYFEQCPPSIGSILLSDCMRMSIPHYIAC